jgi:site-specific recombinase XerD
VIPLRYRQLEPAPLPGPIQYQAEVERFSRSLGVKFFSPNTRRLYVGALERWFAAGGAPGHVDLERLLQHLARRRRSCAVNTVNLDLKALRAFYRHQQAWGQLADGELAKIPRGRRPPQRLPRTLEEAAVGDVLGSLPLDTFLGLRDYCLIRLAFETGLRASELARLRLGDLLDDDTVYVHAGKGRVDRYAPITPELAGILAGYVHARAGLRPGKRAALWLAADGRPLANGRSVWEIVSRRLGAAGTLRGLRATGRPWQGAYPHLLRAAFATALLRRGCPLPAIAQLMGHKDAATTALYLGVDLEQLRAAAELHPRARRLDEVEWRT